MTATSKILKRVKKASSQLFHITENQVNQVLLHLAKATRENKEMLLKANQRDLERMDPANPRYDRLKLTEARIDSIAGDMENVTRLPSPLNRVLLEKKLENGLQLTKISVPIGVIGIVYEARPNVTFDVFSLCLKAGNASILKGGSDAEASNQAILQLIHQVLQEHHLNTNIVNLLPASHEATAEMLQAVDYVDMIIPRGSQQLINFVRENAKVPVIETGAGIVHTYVDENADRNKAVTIVKNAKTRRVSVCNALDCLIIHEKQLEALPDIAAPLADVNVIIFADDLAYKQLEGKYTSELLQVAKEEHYGTEFLDYKLAVKTVKNIGEAINHIARYSSKHSEAIISENQENTALFLKAVDAAAVYANSSTAFTDGAQFGLGAEIGISTQKLHARGPMGLEELTSYKWLIKGNGQVRD